MLVVRVESNVMKRGDTYDTPCTLDTELQAERPSSEAAEGVGENPEGDEYANEENKDAKEGEEMKLLRVEGGWADVHDGETTANMLADHSGDRATSANGEMRIR